MHGVRSCALIYHQSVKKSETLCRSTSHFSIVAIAVLAPFIIIFDVVFLVHSYREVCKKNLVQAFQYLYLTKEISKISKNSNLPTTLDSRIDVEQGIRVGPGKFGKNKTNIGP